MTTLNSLQTLIGYTFGHPQILEEALQAAGSLDNYINNRYNPDGNKRLAILGDSVLKVVICEDWYKSGESREQAGLRSLLEIWAPTNLDRIGRQDGLDAFVRVNVAQGRIVSPVTMTATVEGILGAVYLDGDLHAVK